MDRLREVAFQTVGRAVGFGGLAILCVMAGLAFDPLMAVRAGGLLVLIVLVILLLKARSALTTDYKKTEMWLYLDKHERPAEAYAQWAASTVLRDAYVWFARWTAGVAVVLWLAAVMLSAFGIGGDANRFLNEAGRQSGAMTIEYRPWGRRLTHQDLTGQMTP